MKDWKKVKLGSLLTESKVISENPNPNNRIRVKLNVLGIEKRPETKDKKGATRYYIRKAGQFIYGKQNLHKGAFGIVPQELDGYESSSDIPAFDVDDSCYPEWIFYFFKKGNFYLKLESLAKGIGSKRINTEKIYDLNIFLPTKDEQRKILEEIERAEVNNQKLLKEIKLQDDYLIKLHQSILQDSVEGKLTKDWRIKNQKVESARELFKRLKEEKERLVIDKKIKKQISLPQIKKDEILYEIPNTWSWIRMQDIIKDLRYGTSKKCDYNLGENPVLRIPNIKNGKIDLSDLKSTNLSDKELKDLSLEKDDLLLIRSNGSENLVGRSAVVEKIGVGSAFAGYLVRIQVLKKFINSQYLHIFLESPMARTAIELPLRTTSGVKNINSTEISRIIIPLPPIEEQIIIVQKVNELLLNYKKLETEILESKVNSQKLINSVISELLDDEDNILIKSKVHEKVKISTPVREIKYNSKTTNMDLIQLLKENGKLHAEDLWKMSEHYDDKNINDSIDKFYSDLKTKIEIEKTIKEVTNEKGYVELV
jgi:restriction endonuclease S subunit